MSDTFCVTIVTLSVGACGCSVDEDGLDDGCCNVFVVSREGCDVVLVDDTVVDDVFDGI
jgi:hypothetical protein